MATEPASESRRLTIPQAVRILDSSADFFESVGRPLIAAKLREIKFIVDPSLTIPPEPIRTAKVSTPRCMGCGTTVPEQGMVCPVCADLPRFNGMNVAPKATIETAPQPEPAYRDGAPPVPLVP